MLLIIVFIFSTCFKINNSKGILVHCKTEYEYSLFFPINDILLFKLCYKKPLTTKIFMLLAINQLNFFMGI